MMKSPQSALTEYVVLITEIGHLVVVLGRKADVSVNCYARLIRCRQVTTVVKHCGCHRRIILHPAARQVEVITSFGWFGLPR